MKVIGIVGSRRRNSPNDFLLVQEAFCQIYKEGDMICSGLCWKGADQFAVLLSSIWDTKSIWHPAEWERLGKIAGFVRNSYIANDSNILIACVAQDRKGGTEDTIKKFRKKYPQGIIYLV